MGEKALLKREEYGAVKGKHFLILSKDKFNLTD